MNRKVFYFLLCLLPVFSAEAQVSFGDAEKMNNGWKFILKDEPKIKDLDFDDSKLKTVQLPHDWSVEGISSSSLASATGYLPGGIAWYRKRLNVDEVRGKEKTYLYFEGIYNRSEVYVNGQSVGKRPNGYISFLYDITPYIKYGVDNIIAVRVDHSRSADSRWYTGSGIYRDVYLIRSNPVHIDCWGVFCYADVIDKKNAIFNVRIDMKNEAVSDAAVKVKLNLLNPQGKKVAETSYDMKIKAFGEISSLKTLKVKNPVLWGLNHPNMYTLETKVYQNGNLIDQSTNKVGVRQAVFDPDKGFFLNGENMKLKGVCIHHDAGCLGSAVPRKVWERRLIQLKSLGCNAIRMSHNPQAPDVYDLCDELGLLVMDEAFDEWEFAKRKWIEGWNVGTPGFEGSYDFFEEWSSRDIQDMVKRDRNHPSIIMWSIGNEVDYPNDPYSHKVLDGATINQPMFGGYKPEQPAAERLGNIAKRLVAEVKKQDTSRYVTAALAGVVMSNETAYPGALDIAGYNYTENRYEADHKKYPQRVIYGSENGHGMSAWKSVRDNEYISGQFLWTGIDYLGESGRWPSRGLYSGLLDFGGFIKPRGWFRKALWTSEPMVYIGTYPNYQGRRNSGGAGRLSQDAWPVWNYNQGDNIRVVCYMNCKQAKLLLDGKLVGDLKDYDDNTGIIYWDVPFQPGVLEVIGVNDAKEVCRYEIKSSGRPFAIRATSDTYKLLSNKDLAQITIQVVDENGVPVVLSDDEIICRIEGPAKLIGLESGNNSDMGDYTDNVQRVYRGRLLAYVQTQGTAGIVKVRFSAPWLKSAEVVLDIE